MQGAQEEHEPEHGAGVALLRFIQEGALGALVPGPLRVDRILDRVPETGEHPRMVSDPLPNQSSIRCPSRAQAIGELSTSWKSG